jgi:hypothetical protein
MRIPSTLAILAALLAAGSALAQPAPGVPPAAASPAREHQAIQDLRALLGPEIGLRYRSATVLDGAAGDVRLEEAELRAAGVELQLGSWTVLGQRADGAREWRIERLAYDGGPDLTISVQQARLSGLAIRPPESGRAMDPVGLIGAVQFDHLSIEGVEFLPTEVSIGRLAVEAYGRGRTSQIRLADLGGPWGSAGGSFALASAAIDGFDIATLALMQATGRPGDPARMHGTILAEGFTMEDAGRSIARAESLHGESQFEVAAGGRVSSTDRIVLRGLAVDDFQEMLTELGYPALPDEITFSSRFEQQDDRVSWPDFVLTLPDFGQLALGFELEGLDPQAAPEAVVARMRLLGAMARYRDDGLAPRLLGMLARQGRMTVPAFRARAVTQLAAFLEGPAAASLLSPIKRFLTGQAAELEATLRPPQPLGLTVFEEPGLDSLDAVLARFGIAVISR